MFPGYRQNYFNSFTNFKPKCVFFSGMVTCTEFIKDQKEIFDLIDRFKIPVIFNGVGGFDYSDYEINTFRNFIKKHDFRGFISRDDRAYEAYHDLFPKSYKGIDCAFFISEIEKFKFLNNCDKRYTVFTDVDFNKPSETLNTYKQMASDDNTICCRHLTWHAPKESLMLPRTLLSEMPDQYITLYGQSKMVFSPRVHACIVALSFGAKCILLHNTPRSAVFDTVGCGNIQKSFCSLDPLIFEKRKAIHKDGLKEIMKDIYK